MSDLVDVEKSLRWETRLSLHIQMHLCFNHTRHVSCLFEQIRISFFAVALNTNKQILPFHT